jgi:integrase
MKNQYRLFRRNGTYYYEDATTGKQLSLRTKDEGEAVTLLNAKNEAQRQPALNRQIARTYLHATDPEAESRTWQTVMDAFTRTKTGSTLARVQTAMRDTAFSVIRNLPILETHSTHFLRVLEAGAIATNLYLRRLHNFALDLGWLPCPVLPKRQWPPLAYGEKRAITPDEHAAILKGEPNAEARDFFELLWHIGASQSDAATLTAENIDWSRRVIAYHRNKTGVLSQLHFGAQAEAVLTHLPKSGPLFPRLSKMRESDRAAIFRRRCRKLGIAGITLHAYRYAWAERAMTCGLPERFAMVCLGHTSKAIHRAYAKRAQVAIPTLEEFEGKVGTTPPQSASSSSLAA